MNWGFPDGDVKSGIPLVRFVGGNLRKGFNQVQVDLSRTRKVSVDFFFLRKYVYIELIPL